ncbi:4Fe-4S dicluster domain-containing protein [Halanaerobium hydrogeniformans]|uniref:Iron-sulfur protein n=1 Tax=Halanaerobium hydrogeniformans TaxID=656519 RepID=E4RK76_HALHG|nr:4Fe-4S dicluster-binding protein [Halanaerobium hydrogeniformans]ADQ14628.1 putative iron-sulfur protein [Halanaerobium hydrogeniformans]
MSHKTAKKSYENLVERLNKFPQGAPPSKTLYEILAMLFSEKEAEIVAQLPIKPFTADEAAKILKIDKTESEKILNELATRAILLDSQNKDKKYYILPPPMAGFFEFSMMRTRNDINQKLLAELYYQYLNVEEDFIKDLFLGGETKLGRVYVNEKVLSRDNLVHILDFEKASHIIKTADYIGISTCYCRHKMHHLDKACSAPLDICMTFNNTADSLIRHDHARRVESSECLELLHKAYENNLVQCGENVKNNPSFICNCCGCCCEALVAAKEFGALHPIQTTHYLAELTNNKCSQCQKCLSICPVNAISEIEDEEGKKIVVDKELCLGCGVCLRTCPENNIKLKRRKEKIITPVNSVHRTVMMAIERGKLQNLIFDKQVFASHRAMAAVISAVLKLPPIKQIMANKQLKSKYLAKMIKKFS